jgi:glutaredoxin
MSGRNRIRKVTVVSKTGCHICESAIEDLQRLSGKYGFNLEVLDILKDKELFDKYWLKIPVIRLDGKDVLECEQIAFPKDRMEKLEAILS